MPGHIAKGTILEKLDTYLNDPGTNLDDVLTKLKDKSKFPKLLDVIDDIRTAVGFTKADLDHLRRDWFDEYSGWWREQQPVGPTVRQGFIQACELAKGPPRRPLDCYWVCSDTHHFEVFVTRSDAQITLIHFSPPAPLPTQPVPYSALEPIWIVHGVHSVGEVVEGCIGNSTDEFAAVVRPQR
jgi:hypothetical protein